MLSVTVDGIEYRFFDHLYAVSADGLVLRKLTNYTPTRHSGGYLAVGRRRLLHRMVATCWLVKPGGANHVHHINEVRTDNRASNLTWVTPKRHLNEFHPDRSKGHTMSEAGKQKLRSLRLGSKTSEKTKKKQREASLRLGVKPPPRPIGYKCTKTAIHKMRNNSQNAVGCEIDGISYKSFNEAGRSLHMKAHSIRKRCLSVNFQSYKLLA